MTKKTKPVSKKRVVKVCDGCAESAKATQEREMSVTQLNLEKDILKIQVRSNEIDIKDLNSIVNTLYGVSCGLIFIIVLMVVFF